MNYTYCGDHFTILNHDVIHLTLTHHVSITSQQNMLRVPTIREDFKKLKKKKPDQNPN